MAGQDKREALLARIFAIGAALSEVEASERNQTLLSGIDGGKKVNFRLLDDHEISNDEGKPITTARGGVPPSTIVMFPGIYFLAADQVEGIGPFLNALRIKFFNLLAVDNEIKSLLGNTGAMRYRGCALTPATGDVVYGEFKVDIAFLYAFDPSKF